MQLTSRIQKEERLSGKRDLRIYSCRSPGCIPLTGDFVVWRAARLCTTPPFAKIGDTILSTTGMSFAIVAPSNPLERKVPAAFKCGVIIERVLAFPNSLLCLAFAAVMTSRHRRPYHIKQSCVKNSGAPKTKT